MTLKFLMNYEDFEFWILYTWWTRDIEFELSHVSKLWLNSIVDRCQGDWIWGKNLIFKFKFLFETNSKRIISDPLQCDTWIFFLKITFKLIYEHHTTFAASNFSISKSRTFLTFSSILDVVCCVDSWDFSEIKNL